MELVDRALNGDLRALARLATHIESDSPLGRIALGALYSRSGTAHRIGITGPPGAGKSTIVDGLIPIFREQEKRVAVLAVDPSSSLSGGATLGDRIRMSRWHADDSVFIRSIASRGATGGLARSTIGLAHLFDAAGFDPIIIETMGIGQNEVAVATQSHTTILVQVPGMGDSVQSLKAGILEVGDILIVNKTDRAGSKELVADLRQMIELSEHDNGDWIPKIIETIATDGTGLSALAAAIRHHFCILTRGSEFARRTLAIARSEVSAQLTTELDRRIREQDRDPNLRAAIASVARRERTSLEVMQSLSFFS